MSIILQPSSSSLSQIDEGGEQSSNPSFRQNQQMLSKTKKFLNDNHPSVPKISPKLVKEIKPKQVPLLLKPNGAPVFENIPADMIATIKQVDLNAPSRELERTVKAHSFVVGKKIQNQTELSMLDVKNSAAQEQNFPVKVLYVKPTINKAPKRTDHQLTVQKLSKSAFGQQDKKDADHELERQVSMGEISGIFKKTQKPRPQSAKNSKQKNKIQTEASARLQAKKEYAETVRQQTKLKVGLPPRGKSSKLEQTEKVLPAVKEELAQAAKLRMPHSQNRFKGEFNSLTENLFKKAQEKVRQEKIEKRQQDQEQEAKKAQQAEAEKEISRLNREKIARQKERGPTLSLQQKKEAEKDQKRKDSNKESLNEKRALRAQRNSVPRSQYGLDQIDRGKLAQEQEKKLKIQLMEAELARQKEADARKKQIQRLPANMINKDLLDFSDPEIANIVNNKKMQHERKKSVPQEDTEAQPVPDKSKILQEQRQKRRQEEIERKQKENYEKHRKMENMMILEQTLQQQRDDIQKKQQVATQKAEQAKKEAAKAKSARQKESKKDRKDKSAQLNELRDWIEDQMKMEDKMGLTPATATATLKGTKTTKSQSTEKRAESADNLNFTDKNKTQKAVNIALTKHQLPGNSVLPFEAERPLGVRENRYGINGDNGYSDLVNQQLQKGNMTLNNRDPTLPENILDFTQAPAEEQEEPKSDDSVDLQPVKEEPSKRKIVNIPLAEEEEPIDVVPGMLNVRTEAAKQKSEQNQLEEEAAIVMQKWARGMRDRKRTKKIRGRMERELQGNFDDFSAQFKMNDKFNLNKFLNEKQRLRQLNGTDGVDDDSISEQIQESIGQQDIIESYISSNIIGQSGSRGQSQKLAPRSNYKHMERDPNSLIAIFARQNKLADSPEQLIPEKQSPQRRSRVSPKKVQKQKKRGSDDIDEDIPIASSGPLDDVTESYSEKFQQSNEISESLPQDHSGSQSQALKKSGARVEKQSASLIDESIAESIKQSKEKKTQSSAEESIIEEEDIVAESVDESIPSASIDDDIEVDVAEESKVDDDISEASYLQSSKDKRSPAKPVKTEPKGKFNQVQQVPKKIDRIRGKIEDDYENEGFESYSQSMQAQKYKEAMKQEEEKKQREYKMGGQIIRDFEERKQMGGARQQDLMVQLREELKRYEAAVSGSILVEQFQGIVEKSMAQKDVMIIGQRLTQLEQENKHKQEIADIRAEQIRMMSQLMLLNAGGNVTGPNRATDENIRRQQEQVLQQIQNMLEKPAIIVDRSENMDQSVKSLSTSKPKKPTGKLEQSVNKYSSIEQSASYGFGIKEESLAEDVSDKDDISDEVSEEIEEDDHIAESSQIDESIKESYEDSRQKGSKSEQKQIGAARRLLGSEQSLIQSSKELLQKNQPRSKTVFDNSSFKDFKNDKFKDLLTNDGNMMDEFLDQLEGAVQKKQTNEKKQLQKDFDTRAISPTTYKKKARDLEKWVTGERKQIEQKRAKVKDTYAEIGQYMKKLEKDKKLVLDGLNSTPRQRTRKSLLRSPSNLSASQSSIGVQQMKDQLHGIQSGVLGGDGPETRYMQNKRMIVKDLMQAKKDAIDKGVKERMKELEGEMVDEMMQAALNLDIDKEVDKKIKQIKEMAAEQSVKMESENIEESASKYSQSYLSASYVPSTGKKNKKNVTFKTPDDKMSSSVYSKSSKGKKRQSKLTEESIDEDVDDESIYTESFQQSTNSKLRSRRSDLPDSSGKMSRSNKFSDKPSKIEESKKEDESESDQSLERDSDEDIEEEYSNEFASKMSESIKSETREEMRSMNKLKNKASEIEDSAYSDDFDVGVSLGQSASNKLKGSVKMDSNNQVDVVEEEDMQESSNLDSSQKMRRSSRSKKSKESSLKKTASVEESLTDLEDREIVESTQSVQWQITLQDKSQIEQAYSPSQLDDSAPQVEDNQYDDEEVLEETPSSQVEEDLNEELESEEDEFEDLQSNPTGSIDDSKKFEADVEDITNALLQQILDDFKHDEKVKMVVEDIDEDDFEDLWPYSIEKQREREEEEKKQKAEAERKAKAAAASAEEAKMEENKQESEVKEKYDALMKKYYDEQNIIKEQQKKTAEYLNFIIQVVDKEHLIQALSRPIEHDPLKILEKIQAFDTEDEIELTNMTYSQPQSALPVQLFDEIEKKWEEAHIDENKSVNSREDSKNQTNVSLEAKNVHRLAIFDSFNEALDQERPYKYKGLPNPWSKQTRMTNENLTGEQVDLIIKRAHDKVIEWDLTAAGTKYAPPPPPPPPSGDYDPPAQPVNTAQENEEERNKAERQQRLGMLLTKEVHQRETEWLDYEIEDTQVRFDLADMILEELADEVTQFLQMKQGVPEMTGSIENY